jgi:hypothetical protein
VLARESPPSSRCSRSWKGEKAPPPLPPPAHFLKGTRYTYGRKGMTGGMMPGWMEYCTVVSLLQAKVGMKIFFLFQKQLGPQIVNPQNAKKYMVRKS